MKTFVKSAVDFFLPSHCMYCKSGVENGSIICKECEKALERTEKNMCLKCGLNKKKCACSAYVYHFSRITAPFYNKGIAQNGLYKMKFSGARVLSKLYSHAMAECVKRDYYDINFSKITYVPTGLFREFRRGYDQSRLLAEDMSKELNIPIEYSLLGRTLFSRTQHKRKGIHTRFVNAYKNYYRKGKTVRGNVLLVDDIKTTGASLDACARQLLMAGADEVFCVTALISDKNS